MNPDTGAIVKFSSQKEAYAAGYTIPLADEEAAQLDRVAPEARVAALSIFRGSPILTRRYVPPRRKRISKNTASACV
jgi:hypothetical protein